MRLHFIRNFFRNLNGVKYLTCEECEGPIAKDQPESHICEPSSLRLPFTVTDLTSRRESSYFAHRVKSAGFMRVLRVWFNSYVTGVETTIEDFSVPIPVVQKSGNPSESDRELLFEFDRGEYIVGVTYGCDIHGLYALKLLTTKGRTLEIGNVNLPMKQLNVKGGVVGVFGSFSEVVDHIGFFFCNVEENNFERNRGMLLVRYKGQEGDAPIVKRLDMYLFLSLIHI